MSTYTFRVHPSIPKSPPGARHARLQPEGVASTPRSDNHQIQAQRRPSEYWLNSPAWIDGVSTPPIFFHSDEEILETLREFRPDHPMLHPTAGNVSAADPSPRPSTPAHPESAPTATASAASSADPAPAPSAASETASTSTPKGHMVSVTMVYSSSDTGKGLRQSRAPAKKQRSAKFDYINILELNRSAFICEWLRVHDLADQYSPGAHSGPPFKLWWTGSAGGKTGAITIDSDRDYEVAVKALAKKNQDVCQVGVEFDTDTMDGFRIKKRPLPIMDSKDGEVELLYGTKVPRVEGYSATEQMHGEIIVQLKQKWACEKHQGEHGEPGACYIDSAGNHLGLNNRKLKIWATAIAAADATKHEPLNTVEFDGIRDGQLSSSAKLRGRNGPRRSFSPPPPNADPATLLVTAMIPFLTGLASGSISSASASAAPNNPGTPMRRKNSTSTFSPIPTQTSELHACLADFARIKKIDITESESALAALDLTPDIIPSIPVACLCEIVPVVEGQIYKFQSFCKDWIEHLEEKKRQVL